MSGVPVFRRPQSNENVALQRPLAHQVGSIHVAPLVAPTGDDQIGVCRSSCDGVVVLAAAGSCSTPDTGRVGRPDGKQIDDVERAIAPASGEVETTPIRRIDSKRIRGRRVEHHERATRLSRVPHSGETESVSSVGAERRRRLAPLAVALVSDQLARHRHPASVTAGGGFRITVDGATGMVSSDEPHRLSPRVIAR
jgi:hypothetical protein